MIVMTVGNHNPAKLFDALAYVGEVRSEQIDARSTMHRGTGRRNR